MTLKLLKCYNKLIPCDDRDSYLNKRIDESIYFKESLKQIDILYKNQRNKFMMQFMLVRLQIVFQ